MDGNQLQNDLKALSNHESFARFLVVINELREETISELNNSKSHKVQQISGRILSYDQILQMANYKEVVRRHSDRI